MADVFSRRKRSEIMSRVRSHGNRATETRLIALLKANKISGWRRNWPLFGRPDLAFPRERVAIFVDGCFWHCCPLHRTSPATNKAFWKRKLARNVARDRLVGRTLGAAGWRVLRIWQHELVAKRQPTCLKRIRHHLSHAMAGQGKSTHRSSGCPRRHA